MEKRIEKLEEFATIANDRLARIESRLDQMATKTDLAEKMGELKSEIHRGANETIRWMIGTAVGLGVAAITVITFVLNNATPKTAPVIPSPVTVITGQPASPSSQSTIKGG